MSLKADRIDDDGVAEVDLDKEWMIQWDQNILDYLNEIPDAELEKGFWLIHKKCYDSLDIFKSGVVNELSNCCINCKKKSPYFSFYKMMESSLKVKM